MHDEAVGTLQAHAVVLHGLHIAVPRFELAGPTRKVVEELEHSIVGDGIPEMIAIYVYESAQPNHADGEGWVSWGKPRVLFATHYPPPMGLFSLRPNAQVSHAGTTMILANQSENQHWLHRWAASFRGSLAQSRGELSSLLFRKRA